LDEFTPRREYNEIVIPKTKYRDLRRILLRVLPSGTFAPPFQRASRRKLNNYFYDHLLLFRPDQGAPGDR
jgi:hypothetical protein